MKNIRSIIEDLLYIPLDIKNPPEDAIKGIEDIPDEMMKWDEFRSCRLIPLAIDYNEKDVIEWLPQYIDRFPKLKKWLEKEVIPVTGFGRTLIIVTDPNEINDPHIDAAPDTFETNLNHKFRYVLQGNVDDLEFLTDTGSTLRMPNVDKPFIMNGKWPHKMHNTHSGRKYTLAIGAPWEPDADCTRYESLISKSYKQYHNEYMSCADTGMPDNWETMFEDYDKNKANHEDAKDFAKKT